MTVAERSCLEYMASSGRSAYINICSHTLKDKRAGFLKGGHDAPSVLSATLRSLHAQGMVGAHEDGEGDDVFTINAKGLQYVNRGWLS